ncbi:9633_t:CDS:10 [Ambispora gerdemannii]|uniref:9633_t:CDS:1 n=1 Tax=Ambispora gerdemannii TaxID=144530 RepID=A0A9N8W4K6_9GLOM|nr:9633_t:CDS:10 [Ambispora gerdemannii]
MTIRLLEHEAIQKLRSSLTITSLTHCMLELIQNSLDASATVIEIHVDVSNYFLQVLDNGCGISPEDLQKIGQRYFTSRCNTLEDLQQVTTYGFRGEALASISDVAILEIISKHPNYFDGYSVVLKDGKSIRHRSIRMTKGKQPGTIVIIRDLFYMLPVRRKRRSAFSIVNELENLKREVEIHALINSDVTFILADSSQNNKILLAKKVRTTSNISRFRQLFGDLEYVFAEQDDLRINGFVSVRGYHTKNWPELIDLLSALIKKFLVTFCFLEEKSQSHHHNHQTNRLEEPPIVSSREHKKSFFTTHRRHDHRSADQKLFEDLVHVKSSSSNSNVNSILTEKKIFEDKELKGSHIVVGDVDTSDLATIKNKVSVVSSMKSISESSQRDNSNSENENKNNLNSEPTNEYIKWADPITKHASYIDTRTGNSYKIDRRFLRTSMNFRKDSDEDVIGSCSNWVKEKFKKWNNPIFKNTEAPLPLLSSSNLETINDYNFCSLDKEYRFTKQEIERAEVIGQVDGKFIACKIPYQEAHEEKGVRGVKERVIDDNMKNKNKVKQILVLVDQHAADERIRIEMFLKELCNFKINDKRTKDADSEKFSSIIDTIQLKSPIKIVLSQREAQAAQRYARNKNDYAPIYITHLPEVIVDRCITDTRITQDLIRRHLFWLEENCGGTSVSLEDIVNGLQDDDDAECDKKWPVILRTCPRGILDILNSKACRGAIMFNDLLELDQCQRLVQKLVRCVFPFQCAHGR